MTNSHGRYKHVEDTHHVTKSLSGWLRHKEHRRRPSPGDT